MELKAWTDGGCWPNPGGDPRYGWWVEWEGQEIASGQGVADGRWPKTNNTAEFAGLVACLTGVLANVPAGATSIVIHSDAQLLVDAVRIGWRMQKSPHLAALRDQAVSLMRRSPVPLTLVWIPRHLNARADELAGVPSPPAWFKRMTKYQKKKKKRYGRVNESKHSDTGRVVDFRNL